MSQTAPPKGLEEYRAVPADEKRTIGAGDIIPLIQPAGQPPLKLRILAARQQFVSLEPGRPANPLCAEAEPKGDIIDDNANSVVFVLEFGPFRFYDGSDLLDDLEKDLVCPVDLVGPVDVFQVTHHGLDRSNHPVLIRSLAPTVTVLVNGPRKGCEPGTVAALRSAPSIRANYQLHKNLKEGQESLNAPDAYIANLEQECRANPIKMAVVPDGKSYTVAIPGTGHKRTYRSK